MRLSRAYEVLSDPEARRQYDIQTSTRRFNFFRDVVEVGAGWGVCVYVCVSVCVCVRVCVYAFSPRGVCFGVVLKRCCVCGRMCEPLAMCAPPPHACVPPLHVCPTPAG